MSNVKEKGFSIIELIVVISIIGLMSTVIFANYRQGERSAALEYAAQQIAQDIRHAQNLSLAGSQLDGEFTYGYGIHFDEKKKSEYFIYGDVGAKNSEHQYNSANDKIIPPNPIVLPSNIEINDIVIIPTDSDMVDIFFAPPDPITYINSVNTNNTGVKIKVCFIIDNTKCKIISTTTAGRVEVE